MIQSLPDQHFQAQQPASRAISGGPSSYAQTPYGQYQYQQAGRGHPPQSHPQPGKQQRFFQPPPPPNPSKPRKRAARKWPFIVVLVLALGGLGFYGVQALRDRQVAALVAPYEGIFAPNIHINGIDISGMKPQEALDRLTGDMREKVNSWSMNLTHQGHVFASLNYGSLGISLDENQLFSLLNEAWEITHTGTVHDRKAAIEALQSQPYQKQVAQSELNDQTLEAMLYQIAPFINKDPVDAAIMHFQPDNDSEPFIYQHEQMGARFNVDAAKAEIMQRAATGQSGDFELTGEPIAPNVTVAQLMGKTALRSSISTDISTSSIENRNNNIRVSLSRINGMILKPGETFSFNKVVGPRTIKAGFFEAPEQVYGDMVTGVGGGVCQSSTTLYQAALTAGLTITKRSIHSEKVNYSDLGQDATVYLYGGREIDFAFKNTTPENIYIAARVRPAKRNSKRLVTEIKLYGLSLGEGVSYRMVSETVEILPPPAENKYVVDKTGIYVTYKNEEKLKSKAAEGYVVETYLEKLQNGQVIERNQVSRDRYEPRPAVYYRGNTTPP
jgi:vancomycin resistance protein YoaR